MILPSALPVTELNVSLSFLQNEHKQECYLLTLLLTIANTDTTTKTAP